MYPPEPWHLRGRMWLSVFAVPRSALGELPGPLAAAVRPVPFGRRVLVGAAWARYEPGGTLSYRELLCAALVRDGWRPRVSVVDIWVDSPASRDGARALWGVPKELATIAVGAAVGGRIRAEAEASSAGGAVGTPDGKRLAAATMADGLAVPGRWPVALSLVQALGNDVRCTTARGTTRLRSSRATWRVPPGGPLDYLAGRRPLWTVSLTDLRLRFGGAAPRSAPADVPGGDGPG